MSQSTLSRVDQDTSATSLLSREITGYRSLIETLRQEQEALRTANSDELPAIANIKLQLVSALEELARTRSSVLRKLNFASNLEGMQAWLAADSDPISAAKQWFQLTGLAEEARRLNVLNGRLLSSQQRHFDSALSALWQAAGGAAVYGSDGRPQRASSLRALAAI